MLFHRQARAGREGESTVIAPYIVEAEVPLLRNRVGACVSRREHPKADVTQDQEVQTLVRSVAQRHGHLDTLVNLADGFWGGKSVSETGERDWVLAGVRFRRRHAVLTEGPLLCPGIGSEIAGLRYRGS